MRETGATAIGRLAKERRERIGLRQDELAQYGGPKVSTVGKFERASQDSFPPRTRYQIEDALGWPRGTIERFIAQWDAGLFTEVVMDDWQQSLVEENLPDLSQRVLFEAADPDDEDSAQSIVGYPLDGEYRDLMGRIGVVLGLIPPARREEATLLATRAMLAVVITPEITELAERIRREAEEQGLGPQVAIDATPPSERACEAETEEEEAARHGRAMSLDRDSGPDAGTVS